MRRRSLFGFLALPFTCFLEEGKAEEGFETVIQRDEDTIYVYKHGRYIIHSQDGKRSWYQFDRLDRKDGPAVVYNGSQTQRWYRDGLLHREDGPACIYPGGEKWFVNGVLHREDGPAVSRFLQAQQHDGDWDRRSCWYQKGRLIKCEHYKDGQLHRIYGPAVTKIQNGVRRDEWYQEGQRGRIEARQVNPVHPLAD